MFSCLLHVLKQILVQEHAFFCWTMTWYEMMGTKLSEVFRNKIIWTGLMGLCQHFLKLLKIKAVIIPLEDVLNNKEGRFHAVSVSFVWMSLKCTWISRKRFSQRQLQKRVFFLCFSSALQPLCFLWFCLNMEWASLLHKRKYTLFVNLCWRRGRQACFDCTVRDADIKRSAKFWPSIQTSSLHLQSHEKIVFLHKKEATSSKYLSDPDSLTVLSVAVALGINRP